MITTLLLALTLAQSGPNAAPTLGAPLDVMDPLPPAGLARIGDISVIKGMRDNDLFGTGIVVGLNGTGDSAKATRRALSNLLAKQNIDAGIQDLKDGSAALVMVTAKLPPFAKEGDRIDITISALGDADSLFGGMLLLTPLSGADGNVWATCQGPVTIGGFSAKGASASVAQNHPTVATIHGGATVEADLPAHVVEDGGFEIRLLYPDFETARRMVDAIEAHHPGIAAATDPAAVKVRIPDEINEREQMGFIASVCDLLVKPHARAKVIVMERTGTLVAGEHVRIGRCAIAHGNLTVTIAESPTVSQPAPLSAGSTTVVPRTDITTTVEGNGVSVLPETTTIGDLAKALNALGATPRDLITILQALSSAGALRADLEVH